MRNVEKTLFYVMPKSKLEKQKEAEERANARAKRSHKDQISRLDSLFGQGTGAVKERAKLLARMETKPKKADEESEDKPRTNSRKKSDVKE